MAKLPRAQHDLLWMWVLGGVDAIGKHSTATVNALIRSGHVDRDGPTEKGIEYVDAHERDSFGRRR